MMAMKVDGNGGPARTCLHASVKFLSKMVLWNRDSKTFFAVTDSSINYGCIFK